MLCMRMGIVFFIWTAEVFSGLQRAVRAVELKNALD